MIMEMTGTFPIIVDYSKSLAEMIKVGNYDWVHSGIREKCVPFHCKLTKTELNFELVSYNRFIKSDKVVRDLDNCGLRPATLPKLLVFGSTYPDKQRDFSIIALGSAWQRENGCCWIVCLSHNGFCRELNLDIWDGVWFDGYYFAAVRK
jgi:hypothetical protein